MKEIKVTFNTDGTMKVEAAGFTGKACADATAKYIEHLADAVDLKKAEFYQASVQTKQKIGPQ